VKGALHFRWDQHNDQSEYRATNNGVWVTSPWSHDSENTYSAAIENTIHPLRPIDVTTGISYDYRHMISAQEWSSSSTGPSYGGEVTYPVTDKHAVNPEILVAYHYNATGAVHVSVADRTRFPTLFEMYSTRFNGATSNPNLQPERAMSWETGIADTLGQTHLGANVFYSRLSNAIESVNQYFPALKNTYSQNQNVGAEHHQGFELEAKSQILSSLEIGGNYTFLVRQIVNQNALASAGGTAVAADTPRHSFFGYANWKPIDDLSVVPSVDIGGKRWLASAVNTSYYYRGGDSAVANLKVAYDVTKAIQVEAGVNNILDTNYVVEDGYNGEGRNFFTSVRVKF
jgi:iron complex outermembrane receptor protein